MARMKRMRGFSRIGLSVAAAALAALFGARELSGQEAATIAATADVDAKGFKILVPIESLTKGPRAKIIEGQVRTQIRNMLAGTGAFDRRMFENFYVRFYFPMMTQTSDEALKGLPEERQRFFRDHLEYCKSKDAHQVLINLALDEMDKIVTDTFHPAVRYNAMLIIGGLNEVEPLRVFPYATPEPMPRALPFIYKEFQRVNNPDSIKIAALLGLSRHLEWENFRNSGNTPIQANLRKSIVDELLKLAQTKEPPVGRDVAGHLWLRRRAIEALGYSCSKNADAAIAGTLDGMLRDTKEPLSVRLAVATTLGRMSLQAPGAVDAKATAVELGYLALVACDDELTRVTSLKKTEEEHFIRLAGQLPLDPSQQQGGFVGPRAGIGVGGSADGGLGGMTGPRGSAMGGMPGPGMGGIRPQMPGGSADGGYGYPDLGSGTGEFIDPLAMDPKGYRFEPVRRRLRHSLYCVQVGLLGGEDLVPKTVAAQTNPLPLPKAKAATEPANPTPPPANANYGMRATAKEAPDKAFIEDVYTKVRKLADIVENRSVDLVQLDRDLRREMKNLEAITRKLAPPAAAAAAAAAAAEDDDLLAAPGGAKPAAAAPMPPAATPMPPNGTPAPAPPAARPMPPAGAPAPMPPAAAPMPMPPAGKAATPMPMPPAATPMPATPRP